jgi:DNA repair exonuclease SbcCD ATPase subunit
MINYTKIRFKNFLATGNYFTEISLDRPGITLIVGQNGSGKTTILDAITFALFGRAFRNINKPQIVNSINKKDCIVELEFNVGESSYLVRRGVKPSVFDVVKDGKSLMEHLVNNIDQQSWFESNVLNGLNFKTFSQIVVLSATNYVSFLNLPAASRRQFVEDILQLRNFSTMNVIAKKKAAMLLEQIRDNQSNIELNTRLIENIKIMNEEASENNKDIAKQKVEQAVEIENQKKEFELQLKQIEQSLAELPIDIIHSSQNAAKQLQLDVNKIQARAQYKISQINDQIKFFENNDVCPTCSQHITTEFKQETTQNLIEQQQQQNELLQKSEKANESIKQKIDNLEQQNEQIKTLQQNKAKIKSDIQIFSRRIQEIQQEVTSLIKQQKSHNTERLEVLNQELSVLISTKDDLMEKQHIIETALQLLRDDGIKAEIIKQYVPIINNFVSHYLNSLDYYIGFEFNENFEEVISDHHMEQFSYSSFSQGEKARIDLALLFAWREVASLRNSVKTNLLIMDEVLDGSMDVVGIELLFDTLSKIESSIIIISHREVFIDKIPNTIKFEKHGNFSKVLQYEG